MTGERAALIALAVLLLAVTGLLGYVIYLVAELARIVRWLIYGSAPINDQGRPHMPITRPLLFIVAALVCFVLCLLEATGAAPGLNFNVWLSAGLVAFVAAHIP